MKLKNSFFYTLRENSKDEDSVSGNLLVKSGMIKKTSSGVYIYMPLGFKVLKNIEKIVREEMNKTNALEVLMPSLISEEVYIQSGRRANFGSSMFSLKDRFNKPFVLGPTHEELFGMAAQMKIKSYKDLPFNIYQFQTKFRDEPRPRYGLIRVREFIMKDAYSFDSSLDGLNVSYQKMFDAYKKSFDRMKLKYQIVKADTGVMGGLLSEEFQALTSIGEDTVVICSECDLSSNIEICPCKEEKTDSSSAILFDKEKVSTPNSKSIEEVSHFFNEPLNKFVKTMIYKVDEKFVAVLVRGDYEVNEIKLQKLLDASFVNLATFDEIIQNTNSVVGFVGPIHLNIDVIMDKDVQNMTNFIVGANEKDYHYKNVNLRDFNYSISADIKNIKENDQCPHCMNGKIIFTKGIEIGNTFKLGTKYSKALNLQYLDNNQKLQDVYMGSYGIGIGRCLASIVEQNSDEKGIIFPKDVAPFKVAIVIINIKDEKQCEVANQLYDKLNQIHIDTILDDRDERAGVKFNDLELIGIPIRITVGKKIEQNQVEIKARISNDSDDVKIENVEDFIQSLLNKLN